MFELEMDPAPEMALPTEAAELVAGLLLLAAVVTAALVGGAV